MDSTCKSYETNLLTVVWRFNNVWEKWHQHCLK